jgi:hypothetical protein
VKNAVAAAPRNVTRRFAEAKLLLREAGHWTKGSERRARRDAKKMLHRALRRAAVATIREQE